LSNRRDQIRMSDDEAAAFLEGGRTLQMATINPDGTPHLVAMWYALLDDLPAVWTYGKSQKVQNLRRDPRITVMVEDGVQYDQLRGVQIQGRAEIREETDFVRGIGEALYVRYNDAPLNDMVLEVLAKQAEKRVAILVQPDRVVSWDHGKLGGGY
jgi:PPOX class probable F420-dependent enzyme